MVVPPLEGVLESLRIGLGFLWTAAWAIIMGLTITSLVQVYVSKERMARVLGDDDLSSLAMATAFGAASSGCSFGAVAIGKGLFAKGAHVVNFLAFMFASTNLIVELGLMILILLGWEFLVAELLGGLVLIAVMALIVRLTLPETLFDDVRTELTRQDHDHGAMVDPTCGMEGSDEHTIVTDGGETLQFCSEGCLETYRQQTAGSGAWYDDLRSWGGWYQLGNQYRKEWSMIWTDIVAGFLISGFVIVFVPQWVWNALFLEGDGLLITAENAIMGVTIAVISFVGSMGNVPFAVALWGGGISFAGVIAFVYADLITIPVLNVYRKYYGWSVMLYILGVFFVTMAFTGFLMELLFDALGIVPNLAGGETATEQTYFAVNYTFHLNLVAFALSGFLLYVYRHGLGAPGQYRDPVCGMRTDVDGPSATHDGETYYFCSTACKRAFEDAPAQFADTSPRISDADRSHENH
ncbi:YHS domain-containing protein [Haloterrigena sp. H1]|uniref:permease n=1 Tax=Haloterrigena sp. H1 TaxID=2552943 RepID=UPI00110DE254|nr:permease [Haloterrigena sp. H1]TMT77911.1 YHS domain-containing protein [Haloterrigena sp. H1]TMT78490.1 YHS domain-containing protein [Haloterrigena sp. H1]TMT80413.1 YHS domain-containing protein [Haloterrigena sp. H1]